jgi:hypothetical protein
MFDVLITCAKKDFVKLIPVITAIFRNAAGLRQVHVVSDVPVKNGHRMGGVHYYTDDEILNLDFSRIDNIARRGWYRQQFIKLFQDVTCDNYLVIDADAYLNRSIKISSAFPDFYIGRDQYHKPYFETFALIGGPAKVYPHSFISEMMLLKRGFIQCTLNNLHRDKRDFFESVCDAVNVVGHASSFSEYEWYGNHVMTYNPEWYGIKNIKVCQQKKTRVWTEDEVKKCIERYSPGDYDLITMHSWM